MLRRWELLGRMAGASAHELRNLLTSILGYTALLVEVLPEGVEGCEPSKIERGAQSATEVVQKLLSFSRQERAPGQLVDLNQVVEEMEPMLRALAPRNVSLKLNLQEGLPQIEAHRSQLEQLLVHLVANAGEALEGGGTVEIRSRELGRAFRPRGPFRMGQTHRLRQRPRTQARSRG